MMASPRRSPGRILFLFLRDALVIVLAALVVSFLMKSFLIRSFFIPTESMDPTLIRDDRIIVSQLTPSPFDINRGDVNEEDPLSWAMDAFSIFVGLSSPDNNEHLVKRVIGLPGDTVECCDAKGRMSINGVPLEEPYASLPEGVSKVSSNDFSVVVPSDSLWVMGDNRYNSADSRRNMDKPGGGFVPIDNVVGRAIVISWPQNRWQWLSNFPDTFAGIESRDTSR
jgi:signal peptidase I